MAATLPILQSRAALRQDHKELPLALMEHGAVMAAAGSTFQTALL